jgi:hypothetical protein
MDAAKRMGWCSALVLGVAIFTNAAARADDDEWKHWKHHGYFVPPGHVYYGGPVIYAPRPVVVYEPPPVYYAPAPTYYGPPPGLNLNFNVPLR